MNADSRFFQRASAAFRRYPFLPKALVIVTISGGGLAASTQTNLVGTAYADAGEGEVKRKKVVVLGTGWAGMSFLKTLKDPSYDVQIVSPRNFFVFTPLLPSVTVGTVEARSVVEPIRKIVRGKKFDVQFKEAECYKIDTEKKKVYCRSSQMRLPMVRRLKRMYEMRLEYYTLDASRTSV